MEFLKLLICGIEYRTQFNIFLPKNINLIQVSLELLLQGKVLLPGLRFTGSVGVVACSISIL